MILENTLQRLLSEKKTEPRDERPPELDDNALDQVTGGLVAGNLIGVDRAKGIRDGTSNIQDGTSNT